MESGRPAPEFLTSIYNRQWRHLFLRRLPCFREETLTLSHLRNLRIELALHLTLGISARAELFPRGLQVGLVGFQIGVEERLRLPGLNQILLGCDQSFEFELL